MCFAASCAVDGHAELLGAKEPLMWKLVPVLVREMGRPIRTNSWCDEIITDTLKQEEIRFRRTLERGLAMLVRLSSNIEASVLLGAQFKTIRRATICIHPL